jgi:FkbM family methyltransferase
MQTSLMASILTGQTGCVHAFEPGVLTFARLKRNLQLNGCQNVVTHHAALSDANEEMVLRVDPQYPTFDAHCFVLPLREAGPLTATDEIVPCRKLDDYTLERFDFIKIDVEGEELVLLRGALKTLSDSPDVTLLMECTRNREQAKNFLEEQGFLSFSWDDREQALKSVVFEQAALIGSIVLRRRPWKAKSMSCADRRGL